MERFELSEYYSLACLKVHTLIDELYESLHSETGEPIHNYDEIMESLMRIRKSMFEELDIIKSIVKEYNEISQG
jgi:Mg2+ and Co2+ transporter CorA